MRIFFWQRDCYAASFCSCGLGPKEPSRPGWHLPAWCFFVFGQLFAYLPRIEVFVIMIVVELFDIIEKGRWAEMKKAIFFGILLIGGIIAFFDPLTFQLSSREKAGILFLSIAAATLVNESRLRSY